MSSTLPSAGDEPVCVAAELPEHEPRRLLALQAYDILDTEPEQAFDDLTQVAAAMCDTPIALVSLVDGDRQWFKSRVGLDAVQTPREMAFCSHAILEPGAVLTVPDALLDPRFARNPLVVGDPAIRFYAGSPLVSPHGHALGTLCVIDRRPRAMSPAQHQGLRALARQVVTQMELRRSLLQATEHSLTDALTGAANRRAFDARVRAEWDRLARDREPLSLILLDIDHFKHFNDAFGHLAGDEVLRQVVPAVQRVIRGTDLLARWGGEEFAVLMPRMDPTAALRTAERIRRAIADHPWNGQGVTASLGVATCVPRPDEDVHLLTAAADAALYRSKGAGRNRATPAG